MSFHVTKNELVLVLNINCITWMVYYRDKISSEEYKKSLTLQNFKLPFKSWAIVNIKKKFSACDKSSNHFSIFFQFFAHINFKFSISLSLHSFTQTHAHTHVYTHAHTHAYTHTNTQIHLFTHIDKRQTEIKFITKPHICLYSKFSSMNSSMKTLNHTFP